jgi:hypothetical protein
MLAAFDLSCGAALRAVPNASGAGAIIADYPGGSRSTVAYENLGQRLKPLLEMTPV